MSEWNKNDSDDEELEDDEDYYTASKDAVLFCIEITQSMVSPVFRDGQKSPSTLHIILQAILRTVRRKIVVSGKDLVGVILFNTNETKIPSGDIGMDNLYFLQDLQQVNADNIKELSNLIQDSVDDVELLSKQFKPMPRENTTVLNTLLTIIKMLIKSRAGAVGGRTFLFTDCDSPYPKASQASHITACQTLAKDNHEMGYDMTPIFINRRDSEADFDITRFYEEFFRVGFEKAIEPSAVVVEEGPKMLDDLIESANLNSGPRRAQFTIPFQLGKGLEIGVQGYSLVSEAKKATPIKMDMTGQVPREVQTQQAWADQDTAKPLLDAKDIKSYYKFGGDRLVDKVCFEEVEIAKLKTLGLTPCMSATISACELRSKALRLLGFTDLKHFPAERRIKHAYFVYPTEDPIKHVAKSFSGSRRVFTSLLQTMLQKDCVGLGVFMPRTNSNPCHVVIVAQEEIRDQNDRQTQPPGLHLIQLAFADDMRDVNIEGRQTVHVDGDQPTARAPVDTFKAIIQRMKQRFSSDDYPNPVLNYFYDCLQAVALREDIPPVDDRTTPLYHAIKDRAGDMIVKLKREIEDHPNFSVSRASDPRKGKRKRKADEQSSDSDDELNEATISRMLKNGTLKSLKIYLKTIGKPLSGRKDDLIERIKDHLQPSASNLSEDEAAATENESE